MNDAAPAAVRWLPTDEALRTRRAVRKFLPTPVPREMIEELLTLAARAPSGSNIQPWRVKVVAGDVRARISRRIQQAIDTQGMKAFTRTWQYYPTKWFEPYAGRRRKLGWDLYGLLGIGKGEFAKSEAYRRENYDFFGAPVGLFFTVHRDLEVGSWMDLGIFMSALMIAARGRGLDTCPQAAFADFHSIVRDELAVPEEEIIIVGMALGHADRDAVINRLQTERAPLAETATFHGF